MSQNVKNTVVNPPSHRTFKFKDIQISSCFDSGNCCDAQKVGPNKFDIWIGTDHPKNNYRTWFYFSISGINKGSLVQFTIKNMQNQARLLNDGLAPVCREHSSEQWSRVSQKVNLNSIQHYDGMMQWTFKHNFKKSQKHYFAMFYPWSNEDNDKFLTSMQVSNRNHAQQQIYFYRGIINRSIQDRPIDFLVISSQKGKDLKKEKIGDKNLFHNQNEPDSFTKSGKKAVVISARVHPGEVPGSHTMSGIIKQLLNPQSNVGKLLRENCVFYLFPILNPDGVGRGHHRVDTNGINLNRCYLNPCPKEQPSIYAVRKIISYLNSYEQHFFAYLDLHAHPGPRGNFIYGNCSNQLMKQLKSCIFPKILSLNSKDFQYQGSNFTQNNMYSKDKGDHMSKQGSGRVAMYRLTKNPQCWTLQCGYNKSRTRNILDPKANGNQEPIVLDEENLPKHLIYQYYQPKQEYSIQYFKIQTYHKLGTQICQSLLDLLNKNPSSRIQNQLGHIKSMKILTLNMAISLLKMSPNRFQSSFTKMYYAIAKSQNRILVQNAYKALYLMIIRMAKISNINNFIKTGDYKQIKFTRNFSASPERSLSPDKNGRNANKNRDLSLPFKNVKTRYRTVFDRSRDPNNNLMYSNNPELYNKIQKLINIQEQKQEFQRCSQTILASTNNSSDIKNILNNRYDSSTEFYKESLQLNNKREQFQFLKYLQENGKSNRKNQDQLTQIRKILKSRLQKQGQDKYNFNDERLQQQLRDIVFNKNNSATECQSDNKNTCIFQPSFITRKVNRNVREQTHKSSNNSNNNLLQTNKVPLKVEQFKMIGINTRKSYGSRFAQRQKQRKMQTYTPYSKFGQQQMFQIKMDSHNRLLLGNMNSTANTKSKNTTTVKIQKGSFSTSKGFTNNSVVSNNLSCEKNNLSGKKMEMLSEGCLLVSWNSGQVNKKNKNIGQL